MATPKSRQLGQLIRRYREAKGWSQRTAADKMGYHHSYLARIESGAYASPAPKQLKAMARTLGAPIEDLYALAGYQVPERLPALAPYLRAKYDLPEQAVDQLEEYFELLNDKYGGSDGRPMGDGDA